MRVSISELLALPLFAVLVASPRVVVSISELDLVHLFSIAGSSPSDSALASSSFDSSSCIVGFSSAASSFDSSP